MADQRIPTVSDIEMLQYFWEEKGDIERYADYKKIAEYVEKNTYIIEAFKEYKKAIEVAKFKLKHAFSEAIEQIELL